MKKQKICIIGGSLAGLTTAISLSKLNCDIDLITGNIKKNAGSNRTIAISESNLNFLKKLNISPTITEECWPCSKIELYTNDRKENFSKIFEFNSPNKEKKVFYMLENKKILNLMIKKIKKIKTISLKKNEKIEEIKKSGLLNSIKFNKNHYTYNLIIICSGSNSNLVKNLFNKKIIENSYKETSITLTLDHSSLKNDIVRQVFFDNEILAFLPISKTQTSVVWSVKKNLYEKNNLIIKNKIKKYANKYLKNISFPSKIEFRDINFLIRNKYYKDRILLFGDALHVVHPFVGQGFNMILRDLLSLENLLSNKINLGLDIGSSDILSEFTKITKPRNFIYSVGIDLMKNSFSINNQVVKKIRNSVLKKLNNNSYIKDIFFNIADRGLKF